MPGASPPPVEIAIFMRARYRNHARAPHAAHAQNGGQAPDLQFLDTRRYCAREAVRHRSRVRRLALLACLAPIVMGARTVDHYPVANGIGSAAVRLSDGRLDSFRPAPYAALDQGIVTPELAFDAYFAVRQGSMVSTWLTDVPIDEVRSVADANAVVIVQRPLDVPGLRIETAWLSPYALERPAVLAVVTVTNEGASTISGLSFPSIANFRM